MIRKLREGVAHPEKVPSYAYNTITGFTFRIRNQFAADTQTLSVNGYEAEFRSETYADARFLRRFPESEVLADLVPRLNSDDVFWDVGANIGLYSCFAGKVGATVVAFEPDGPTRSSLEENVSLNEVQGTVLPYGLGETTDIVKRELNMQRENKPTTVETRTGDRLVERDSMPEPSVIKVDIEGMEFSALRGLSRTIADTRLIYAELHPEELARRGESASAIKDWLSERGFELSEVQYEGSNPIVRGETSQESVE